MSEANHRQYMIPRGIVHDFIGVLDRVEFAYKCDELYHTEDEGGPLWNDLAITIDV